MVGDIRLLENETILDGLRFPYKIDKVTQIVVTRGRFSCIVDFRTYSLDAPAVALFLPGQVVESFETDDDFTGFGIMMSSDFTDSMNLPISLQERLFIKNTQFYSISSEVVDVLSSVYRQVSSLIKQHDNPYKEDIIRHLFSAYYYGLGYYMHGIQSKPSSLTAQQEKCEKFMSLVSEHFKTEREIEFYANKLCVSKKYLSSLLKQETGMTALEWIERYVVLYAKSCLTSTTMTIQQISDELEFSSQSVFGKYFKRVEGVSPKAYRNSRRSDDMP
jgi:AraC-like DNA-binding protein